MEKEKETLPNFDLPVVENTLVEDTPENEISLSLVHKQIDIIDDKYVEEQLQVTIPRDDTPPSPVEPEDSVLIKSKHYLHQDSSCPEWFLHKKHFFVLSQAGKPIFSRYGDEQRLAPFMASLMAIISFVEDTKDKLRYIVAGRHKFIFEMCGPLYLVCISNTDDHIPHLRKQLIYIHRQILSILTKSSVTKIFNSRATFDLRNLLGSSDKFLQTIIERSNTSTSITMDAYSSVVMSPQIRNKIAEILHSVHPPQPSPPAPPDLLFSILFSGNKLITLVRPRQFSLHSLDLQLAFNFVNSSFSLRHNESWTPLCLPAFDDAGFLHAYVCFIHENIGLLLLSTKADSFYTLSQSKSNIVEKMKATKIPHSAISKLNFDKNQIETLFPESKNNLYNILGTICTDPTYSLKHINHKEKVPIVHFICKITAIQQVTCPKFEKPYTNKKERKRLLMFYKHARERLIGRQRNPHKMYFFSGNLETMVACIDKGHELFVVFSPLVTKCSAYYRTTHLLNWLKSESISSSLFILNSPLW